MHINTYRLSQNSCNPYCNSLHANKLCGPHFVTMLKVTEDVRSKTPFCTTNSRFSLCLQTHHKALAGMWLLCIFQFLVHPLSGCDSISYICIHMNIYIYIHTHTHILFEGMVQDVNTIPEELSGPLKAAYSFLFDQLSPFMCHVNLAWHKFQTLCAVLQT